MTRALLRRTSLLMLSMLLFTQGALAATSCTWAERSPAKAIAGGDVPPCHESAPEQRNRNLCLADCESGMQSLDKPSVSVYAMPAIPVLSVESVAPAAFASPTAALPFEISPAGAPPPRILFHSFLI